MARESPKSKSIKHHSTSKQSTTSTSIRAAKQVLLAGPDVEIDVGQKQCSINDINGIPTMNIEDGMVEDMEEDSESDKDAEEGLWYQRHGRKDEVEYWKLAVYGFIVGANPPWQILEGFQKRIWHKYAIDKISFLPNGLFIARFQTNEMKQAVFNSGHFLFHNKPMIFKSWVPDIELTKEEVKCVPAWIRLNKLPLKFWGKSIVKLANLVGTYVKSNNATDQKTRLGFACVMVELQIDQKFPKTIKFLDEKKQLIQIDVEYEWKPTLCTKCKQLAHEKDNCRKDKRGELVKVVRKEWRPIKKSAPNPPIQLPAHLAQSSYQQNDIANIKKPETRPSQNRNGTLFPVNATWKGHHRSSTFRPGAPTYIETFCLFGLLETKIKSHNVTKALVNVFNDWSVSTNTAYHSGGRIWVVWKPQFYNVLFLEYNAQYNHLQAEERWGGSYSLAESEPFQQCLEDCELMNMLTSGSFYTWNNKQPPQTRVYSRLDRACVNQGWVDQFPDLYANFLPEGVFDHAPCVIGKADRGQHKNRPFKYFNMWSSAPDFAECVVRVWNQSIVGTKMFGVIQKLKALKPELKKINRSCYSDVENQALLAETKLLHVHQQLIHQPSDQSLMEQEYAAHQASLQLQKEKMNEDSIVQKGTVCIDSHIQRLLTPVTREEIKVIIFNIPNDKAPSPDGYSSKFYKDSWDIVRKEVSSAVLDFFTSGSLLKQVNTTLVTLIPKVERPETGLQYRPIFCCNVIYKCISKVLCNRLATVLPDLISQNQGGFIQGRSIMDNILICQDIIRVYERKAISPMCLFKMDLQKAYDTMEWSFLDQMLTTMNFPRQFRKWIMQCVTTTSYSLTLNGNMFGFFKGQRGLRQGDPLCPLLFTICMEYLSRLLLYSTASPDFKFYPLCKPLQQTHLMFADDLLLFSKGYAHSMMTLLRNFSTFSKTTGLNMSKGKSNAYFNGVPEGLKSDIFHISGMVEGTIPFRLVLVKAVLKTLHTYWATMFILPSGPRDEGGLGLKNEVQWNKAAWGKLVWWVATQPDHLWVRWVSDIYIKGKEWQTYDPPTNSSWYWRRICRVKKLFTTAYQQQIWSEQQGKEYTIAKGYDFLRDKGVKVNLHDMVWNKWNIPKHSFISWVYHHKNMNTMEKLYRLDISDDDTCCIYKISIETVDHLFFQCSYSREVLSRVGDCLGIVLPYQDLLTWHLGFKGSKLQRGVVHAVINACLYHLWKQRNQSRTELILLHPSKLAQLITEEMKKRVSSIVSLPVKGKDRNFV
ncbi:uncharacterized protein LOC141601429 [Silene latifolia]|uniref:uncharacterized protein LOC141601429 n=1 Tax=Silene latifolia TaxID=37657 RepID=UPI003D7771AE